MFPSASATARVHQDPRRQEIVWAQVRLLYANANLGAFVTILAATILGRFQWPVVPHAVVALWWAYMVLISAARYALARRFRQASTRCADVNKWRVAYTILVGLAGAGWGGAGILLYPEAHLANQVSLVFVVGGMMLGAASLLAARAEAFVAFLCPAGLLPAGRFLAQGDETHIAMGVLAGVFTVAVLITTMRIHATVESSLELQFENRDLIEDLRRANERTEALNQALELRVEERTAELQKSAEQLRAEIAHREQIQEELLRVRNLESLGALAGGIAHDFNNFLTIVQGNIELAKEQSRPGEPIQEILDETARACRRAASLSAQLLTFAKGGAPVRRVVPVSDLIMDAVHLVRAGAPISVSVSMPEDLRCAPVDRAQIVQVLHSILLNARESMPDGGIIEVSAENAVREEGPDIEPRARISIRDYGCGIPRDILHRIFDPYFSTKAGHSGLGLATAYAIVAKHGGHIAVDSKPGDGTVVTVELPASDERPAAQAPRIAQPQMGTGRLLIMDDEEGVRKLLETFLTRLGYEVETAGDGAEAITMYQAAKAAGRAFDAVLLDLTVSGGMGGIETAAKLKELDPATKLIVSSGYSDAPVMSDFARYGFEAMIPKPSNLNEIADVFRSVLVPKPDFGAD